MGVRFCSNENKWLFHFIKYHNTKCLQKNTEITFLEKNDFLQDGKMSPYFLKVFLIQTHSNHRKNRKLQRHPGVLSKVN